MFQRPRWPRYFHSLGFQFFAETVNVGYADSDVPKAFTLVIIAVPAPVIGQFDRGFRVLIAVPHERNSIFTALVILSACLLYTSDAADE